MSPNLPTDNLYKFLALSGTVIALLCTYFAQTKVWEVSDRIIDTQQAQQLADTKSQSLKKTIDRLEKRVASLIHDLPKKKDAYLTGTGTKNDARLELRLAEIESLNRQIDDSAAELSLDLASFCRETRKNLTGATWAKFFL
jgi:predicted RNase H-like nuclease (RuvC/YqgF family)